jgi:hypothetical protein
MVRFLPFNHRTSSRMIKGGSVHYEQFANWRSVGFGRRDKRTRKRPFGGSVVVAEGLAFGPKETTLEM